MICLSTVTCINQSNMLLFCVMCVIARFLFAFHMFVGFVWDSLVAIYWEIIVLLAFRLCYIILGADPWCVIFLFGFLDRCGIRFFSVPDH